MTLVVKDDIRHKLYIAVFDYIASADFLNSLFDLVTQQADARLDLVPNLMQAVDLFHC